MNIDIITIFPKQIQNFISEGIFRIASTKDTQINVHDLRKWTTDKHKSVDDRPFGGGAGMVMKIEPIYKSLKEIKTKDSFTILTSPKGKKLTSSHSKNLAQKDHLIIICGHYEGVDERVREHLVDEEISIGDYVLSGGELPALVIIDSVVRHIPGVLGNPNSLSEESFEEGIDVEYPQYTRPADFRGWKVPEVLVSGDHSKIKKWRKAKTKVK